MSQSSPSGSVSLAALAGELGPPLSAWPIDTFETAAALQRARHQRGIADRGGVTRSTLFYALCRQSTAMEGALTSAGLRLHAFASELRIDPTAPLPPPDSNPALIQIEPELAVALRRDFAGRAEVTEVTLGLALLHSAVVDGGLFTERLTRAGVDLDSARDFLARSAQDASPPEDRLPDNELSRTVREIRSEMLSLGGVTAGTIVNALRPHHPEYGAEEFAAVPLDVDVGERRSIDQWLLDVRDLFDMGRVRRSTHSVLDGRLVILALVECDDDLAAQLDTTYFLARLRGEVEVMPLPASGDDAPWWADTPARIDMLGRSAIADLLVGRLKLIRNAQPADGAESFLVHLEAPWGAGKSSLFELITERLSARPKAPSAERKSRPVASADAQTKASHDRPFLVVPVNAWREQRVGAPWWTLLRSLQRETLAASVWWRRPIILLAAVGDRIRTRLVPFAAAIVVAVGIAIGIWAFPKEWLGTGPEPLLRLLSLGALVFAGIVTASRFLLPGSKWTAEQLVEHGKDPMEQVARLFEGAFRRSPGDVVFLIDDLDRCDADYVVDFLEVLQTTVRTAPDRPFSRRRARDARKGSTISAESDAAQPLGGVKPAAEAPGGAGRQRGEDDPNVFRRSIAGPFAIVAADGAWLRGCYHQRFADSVLDSVFSRPLGYLFLEKFFQLRIVVPAASPSSQMAYLRHLLKPSDIETSPTSSRDDTLFEEATAAARKATSVSEVTSAAILARAIDDPAKKEQAQLAAAARFTEARIEATAAHRLGRFANLLDPNPRSVKRLVNTYSVVLSLRTAQGLIPEGDPLALWAILEIRWPELADRLRDDPDLIERWSGKRLSSEESAYFRHPDIEKVLSDKRWRGLDAARVRECAGVLREATDSQSSLSVASQGDTHKPDRSTFS